MTITTIFALIAQQGAAPSTYERLRAMPRPTKKTVEQTLDYQADCQICAAIGAGEDQALLLYRKLVMFLYGHELQGNVHLIGSLSTDAAIFEISLTSRTVLSGTATQNARVFEALWSFFEKDGFRFTVVLGDARAESLDPGEPGKAESEIAEDQLVTDLAIDFNHACLLHENGLNTVGEIQSTPFKPLRNRLTGADTGLGVRMRDELAGMGIFFQDDPRANTASHDEPEAWKRREIEFRKKVQGTLIRLTGIEATTRDNLIDNGLSTLGDLLRHTEEEVRSIIGSARTMHLVNYLHEHMLTLYPKP